MNCDCCGEITEKPIDGSEFGYDQVCPECMKVLEGPIEE